MSEIPPKHTPDNASYDAPESGGGLVAMYNAASHAGAESFPVLKAFQDYIEAERTQARKRVMQLSIFFAVLMTVVVGGFLAAGIAMWRNNAERENKLLEAVIAKNAAPAPVPAPVPAPLAQPSPVLEESARQMSRVATELQSTMDKKLDGVSAIATKVHEKVASQDGELEKLRADLLKMQEQSEKLKDELVTIKKSAAKPAAAVTPPRISYTPPPAAQLTPAAAKPPAVKAPAPVAAAAPAAQAPAAPLPAQVAKAEPVPAAPKAEPRDPRFPPATKAPPVAPDGVTPPAAPKGMMATAIPLKTKNTGTVPWRVLIPE